MGRALTQRVLLLALLASVLSGAASLRAQAAQQRSNRGLPTQPQQDDSSQRQNELARAAVQIRKAWLAHDASAIVSGSGQLVVQLPGADPSAALGNRQAAALLADYLNPAREVDLDVRAVREVEPGRGYIEILRHYRVEGTQDVQAQSLFFCYRRAKRGWVLVELRAIEP